MINYKVIPLGDLLCEDYSEEKLINSFKKFSCNRENDLEDFLNNKAILYERTNYGKTHLIIDIDRLKKDDEFVVAAYFTIAQKSIDISALSKNKKRRMLGSFPGRDSLESVSTYLIGQLGRDDNYSHYQLTGEQILNECYHSISTAARIVGGNLVVLECREHMLEKFYEPNGFKKLYDQLDSQNLYTLYKKIDFKEYWGK